jgi:hypothetical protein
MQVAILLFIQICETSDDVTGDVLPFNKEGMSQVIDIVDLVMIAFQTPIPVPHVFSFLFWRNLRPRQDVDAVSSQKLCCNTNCVVLRVVHLQKHCMILIWHKWEKTVHNMLVYILYYPAWWSNLFFDCGLFKTMKLQAPKHSSSIRNIGQISRPMVWKSDPTVSKADPGAWLASKTYVLPMRSGLVPVMSQSLSGWLCDTHLQFVQYKVDAHEFAIYLVWEMTYRDSRGPYPSCSFRSVAWVKKLRTCVNVMKRSSLCDVAWAFLISAHP